MQEFISGFAKYLRNEKKSSKNTLESYIRDVEQFSSFIFANGIKSLCDVDSVVVERYFEYLHALF